MYNVTKVSATSDEINVSLLNKSNNLNILGVSPTKDFHSRIGIFESCR